MDNFASADLNYLGSVSVIWTSCLVAWTPNAGPGLSWASTFSHIRNEPVWQRVCLLHGVV